MERKPKKVTAETGESAEMLPAKTHFGVSFVQAPNVEAHLENYRANIKDVLCIADEDWPDGKAIEVELELMIMPSKIKTTVRKETLRSAEFPLITEKYGG